jgi:hypothetical protein
MKILIAFKYSALRSMKIWKGVLLVWFSSLLTAGLVAIPVKKALMAGFSDSMITERLARGIRLEVFSDLGPVLKSIVSLISGGLVMAILVWFILNVFFTGGIFQNIRNSEDKFRVRNFLGDSARNFWSFLVIDSVMSVIFVAVIFLVIILPVSIVSQSDAVSDGTILRTVMISFYVFLFVTTILLLVADYARAWQVSNTRNGSFRAIGFGFGRTFRTFFLSMPAMIVLLAVQALFGWLVLSVLPAYSPVKGSGVFLFLVLSQMMFFVKIMLKVWRYGSITSLMEQKNGK